MPTTHRSTRRTSAQSLASVSPALRTDGTDDRTPRRVPEDSRSDEVDPPLEELRRRTRRLREEQWRVLQEDPVDWKRLGRLSDALYEIERQKMALRRSG